MTKDIRMTLLPQQDFTELNHFLEALRPSKIFILTDENCHEHCLPVLLQDLTTVVPLEIIEIAAGEEMKTIETATHLWEILAEFSADRRALLLNVGGGVITDLGGFVASTYKRGLGFIHIPTTLLAMCDAALGGKTGIDHLFLKNIVGTFALPKEVFVQTDFLKTLPFEELRSGFAEMLKHGLIADKEHWSALTTIDTLTPQSIAPHIRTSMEIKQQVVEQDFQEGNLRKILNFGHTVGHALESLFLQHEKPIKHGEAVAAGMICEAWISKDQSLITEAAFKEIAEGILKFFPVLNIGNLSSKEFLQYIFNDKKNTASQLRFSLLTGIGNCIYDFSIDAETVLQSLNFYKSLKKNRL